MKISIPLPSLLAVASLLALSPLSGNAQSFDAAPTARNHALASAPRSLEAYPWLAARTEVRGAKARTATTPSSLASVRSHGALSAQPRILEQFPELTRDPASESTAAASTRAPAHLRNQALAATPRTVEQFPALTRTAAAPVYEIAPLK